VPVLNRTPDLLRVGASARDHHPRKLNMATAAQSLRHSAESLSWIRGFLKEELSPYAGRVGVVARMVLATTLIMIVCMTFRIPYGFQAAFFALLVSRESPRATLLSSAKTVIGISVSAAYVLLTVRPVISDPSCIFCGLLGRCLSPFTFSAQ
jgi:multidrug resistance protein MdtO